MDTSFSGGIFCETLDDGRAGGEVQLQPAGVSASAPDGQVFLIPYRDCQVEMGGFSGKMVFCRNADRSVTIYCEDPKFVNALSLASSGILDEQLRAGRKQQRGESRRQWVIGTVCLVILLAMVVGVYFGIRSGATAAVKALPVSVDVQIGEAAFGSMDLGGPEVENNTIVDAMQSIVDRLAPQAAIEGMEFEIHVVESPMINAFALPGGTMVVYTGLIANADNAEQVASVLAHEMAHATKRHGLQRIARSMGIWAGVSLLVGDVGGLMGAGADLFRLASVNSYSRTQETEADQEGARMMHAAGIDPSEMGKFFAMLEKEHGDTPDFFAWISTHPDHSSRIASVEKMVASFSEKQYQPLKLDWDEIQKQVQRIDSE
jgi:predicted Zn-dependent protease